MVLLYHSYGVTPIELSSIEVVFTRGTRTAVPPKNFLQRTRMSYVPYTAVAAWPGTSNPEDSKILEQDFGQHERLRDSLEAPAGLTSPVFKSSMGSVSWFEALPTISIWYNQYKGLLQESC